MKRFFKCEYCGDSWLADAIRQRHICKPMMELPTIGTEEDVLNGKMSWMPEMIIEPVSKPIPTEL